MPLHKMQVAGVLPMPNRQSHSPSHAPLGNDISELETRIRAARILREHHVWEAVRIAPALGGFRDDAAAFARFRHLMSFDSLVDALFLLAAKSTPALSIRSITRSPQGWLCRIAINGRHTGQHAGFSPAFHADRAAAVLLALLAAMKAADGDFYVQ